MRPSVSVVIVILLPYAIQNGYAACTQALIDASVQVNSGIIDRNGETYVSLAASTGHIDVLKVLIAANASLDAEQGKDPLVSAVESEQFEVMDFLL